MTMNGNNTSSTETSSFDILSNLDLQTNTWCEECSRLQKDVENIQREYMKCNRMVKEKIIQTDKLIKMYSSKCQECDQQSKAVEELKVLLSKYQRERETMSNQLRLALEDVEPLRKANNKLEKKEQNFEKLLEEHKTKIESLECSLRQQADCLDSEMKTVRKLEEECKRHRQTIKELESQTKKLENSNQKYQDQLQTKKVEVTHMKKAAGKQEKVLLRFMNAVRQYQNIVEKNGIGEQVSKSLRSLSVKNLEELMQNGIEVKEENDDEKELNNCNRSWKSESLEDLPSSTCSKPPSVTSSFSIFTEEKSLDDESDLEDNISIGSLSEMADAITVELTGSDLSCTASCDTINSDKILLSNAPSTSNLSILCSPESEESVVVTTSKHSGNVPANKPVKISGKKPVLKQQMAGQLNTRSPESNTLSHIDSDLNETSINFTHARLLSLMHSYIDIPEPLSPLQLSSERQEIGLTCVGKLITQTTSTRPADSVTMSLSSKSIGERKDINSNKRMHDNIVNDDLLGCVESNGKESVVIDSGTSPCVKKDNIVSETLLSQHRELSNVTEIICLSSNHISEIPLNTSQNKCNEAHSQVCDESITRDLVNYYQLKEQLIDNSVQQIVKDEDRPELFGNDEVVNCDRVNKPLANKPMQQFVKIEERCEFDDRAAVSPKIANERSVNLTIQLPMKDEGRCKSDEKSSSNNKQNNKTQNGNFNFINFVREANKEKNSAIVCNEGNTESYAIKLSENVPANKTVIISGNKPVFNTTDACHILKSDEFQQSCHPITKLKAKKEVIENVNNSTLDQRNRSGTSYAERPLKRQAIMLDMNLYPLKQSKTKTQVWHEISRSKHNILTNNDDLSPTNMLSHKIDSSVNTLAEKQNETNEMFSAYLPEVTNSISYNVGRVRKARGGKVSAVLPSGTVATMTNNIQPVNNKIAATTKVNAVVASGQIVSSTARQLLTNNGQHVFSANEMITTDKPAKSQLLSPDIVPHLISSQSLVSKSTFLLEQMQTQNNKTSIVSTSHSKNNSLVSHLQPKVSSPTSVPCLSIRSDSPASQSSPPVTALCFQIQSNTPATQLKEKYNSMAVSSQTIVKSNESILSSQMQQKNCSPAMAVLSQKQGKVLYPSQTTNKSQPSIQNISSFVGSNVQLKPNSSSTSSFSSANICFTAKEFVSTKNLVKATAHKQTKHPINSEKSLQSVTQLLANNEVSNNSAKNLTKQSATVPKRTHVLNRNNNLPRNVTIVTHNNQHPARSSSKTVSVNSTAASGHEPTVKDGCSQLNNLSMSTETNVLSLSAIFGLPMNVKTDDCKATVKSNSQSDASRLATLQQELQFAIRFASLKLETIVERIQVLCLDNKTVATTIIQTLVKINEVDGIQLVHDAVQKSSDVVQTPILPEQEMRLVVLVNLLNNSNSEYSLIQCLLCELRQSIQENITTLGISESVCRLYTAMCRLQGLVEQARVLVYDLLYMWLPSVDRLVVVIAGVWPAIFYCDGSAQIMQAVIQRILMKSTLFCNQTAENQVSVILKKLCNWNTNSMSSSDLASAVLTVVHARLLTDSALQLISEETFVMEKALELLIKHEEWSWVNDSFLLQMLWPRLQQWAANQSSLPNAYVCFMLRMLGEVIDCCQIKDDPSVSMIINTLNNLVMALCVTTNLTQEVQEAAIEAFLKATPFNSVIVAGSLRKWLTTRSHISASLCEQIKRLIHVYRNQFSILENMPCLQ